MSHVYYFERNLHSQYLTANDDFTQIVGLNAIQDLCGLTNFDLPITHENLLRTAEIDAFHQEDNLVTNHGKILTTFCLHFFDNEPLTYLLTKAPLKDADNITGMLANGVRLKNPTPTELNYYINNPQFYISGPVLENIAQYTKRFQTSQVFVTRKEAQILYLMAYGYSSREIGDILYKSSRTVETQVNNLKNKLDCDTKRELIQIAIHNQLINLSLKNIKSGLVLFVKTV